MTDFKSPYIAFSAPSGAGKTTIVKRLAEKFAGELVISVSATTRRRRPQEKDGVDYYFLTKEQFEKAIAEGRFLEYEEVHGNYYGTLIETIESQRKKGKTILFDIDVKGALSVKRRYPQALLIFIKPPSEEELVRRLQARRSEDEASIKRRLQRLKFEYEQAQKFDYIVLNDKLDDTLAQVEELILKKE